MSQSKGRLKEFEALRALSILLLFALHSEVFDPLVFGEIIGGPLAVFVASFLLGSFFFLAGYFTEVSLGKPASSAFVFVRSKFIRIFPPYWLALLLFIFVMGYNLNRTGLAVYALNLQAVFSPAFVKQLLTLWYISMLVVFYILYGVLMVNVRSSWGLLIGTVIIFAAAYWAHATTDLFDLRFFQYYFLFLAGVYFCRFESIREWLFSLNIFVKLFLAALTLLLFLLALRAGYEMTHGIYILTVDLYILSWVLMWLSIFRTKMGDWQGWVWISTASFFAYLYHRPLWQVMDTVLGLEPGLEKVLMHLVPGAILALILGYYLQRGYDSVLAAMRLK